MRPLRCVFGSVPSRERLEATAGCDANRRITCLVALNGLEAPQDRIVVPMVVGSNPISHPKVSRPASPISDPIPCFRKGSWHRRQRGARAQQVGADPDGLAELGFGLRLFIEAKVSQTGEVMGVGARGAACTSAGGPRGLHQGLE